MGITLQAGRRKCKDSSLEESRCDVAELTCTGLPLQKDPLRYLTATRSTASPYMKVELSRRDFDPPGSMFSLGFLVLADS